MELLQKPYACWIGYIEIGVNAENIKSNTHQLIMHFGACGTCDTTHDIVRQLCARRNVICALYLYRNEDDLLEIARQLPVSMKDIQRIKALTVNMQMIF